MFTLRRFLTHLFHYYSSLLLLIPLHSLLLSAPYSSPLLLTPLCSSLLRSAPPNPCLSPSSGILLFQQHFTGQREDFESTRESMLVWLTELDLQLTNVEHFSQSDVHHKIEQLNVRRPTSVCRPHTHTDLTPGNQWDTVDLLS